MISDALPRDSLRKPAASGPASWLLGRFAGLSAGVSGSAEVRIVPLAKCFLRPSLTGDSTGYYTTSRGLLLPVADLSVAVTAGVFIDQPLQPRFLSRE